MIKIQPFLWFDTQAEEAVNLYVATFKNSKIGKVVRYGEGPSGPDGKVMTVEFEIDGQPVVALNGGPYFKFTEAVSFTVSCEDQAEVDRYWTALTADGGEESRCGWLKDRFGLSWQIVPIALPRLLSDPDPARAKRARDAMMTMRKIDVAALESAAAAG